MSLKINKSPISWNWSKPSSAVVGPNFVWENLYFESPADSCIAVSKNESDKIDVMIGAIGAQNALKIAFKKEISRSLTWDVHKLKPIYKNAVVAAAKIFKRGVGFDDGDGSKELSQSGRSEICFLDNLFGMFEDLSQSDVVIADSALFERWNKVVPEATKWFHFSEHEKDLAAVMQVFSSIPKSVERVFIVGGGVLGDVAGFAAGLRNKQCVYIPTTLLAMADSSIGGKTGVNFAPWGKNQVGLFHPPLEVRICADWLQSLPEREIKAGLSECLKHALISGKQDLWDALIELASSFSIERISGLLFEIVKIKAEIVARDPFERGERAILNLGHTFGHALETFSQEVDGEQALNHGECVAIGLVYALELSEKVNGMNSRRWVDDLRKVGLVKPISRNVKQNPESISRLLLTDKKNSKGTCVSWILLKDFGEVQKFNCSDGKVKWTVDLDSYFFQEILKTL